MGVDETLVNEIVRRLSVARPDRIILFGSAATAQRVRSLPLAPQGLGRAAGGAG